MAGQVGKINVAIEADNKGLKSGLRQAESQVNRSAQKMQKSIEKNVRFGAAFTKILALGGALEAGLKGARAITRAWNGDLQGAHDIIKTMPMGIGQIADAAHGLALEWMGVGDMMERADKSAKAHAANKKTQQSAGKLIAGLQMQVRVGAIDDPKEKALEQAKIRMEQTMAKLGQIAGMGGKFKKGQQASIQKLAKTLFNQQVRQIQGRGGKNTGLDVDAGFERGFEKTGLSRSRLSGRGGALEVAGEKPPTKKGQMDMVQALKELVSQGKAGIAIARAG